MILENFKNVKIIKDVIKAKNNECYLSILCKTLYDSQII